MNEQHRRLIHVIQLYFDSLFKRLVTADNEVTGICNDPLLGVYCVSILFTGAFLDQVTRLSESLRMKRIPREIQVLHD